MESANNEDKVYLERKCMQQQHRDWEGKMGERCLWISCKKQSSYTECSIMLLGNCDIKAVHTKTTIKPKQTKKI